MLSEKKSQLDFVFELQIPDKELAKRITGRRVHTASGRVYNVFFDPPKVEGIDDITGEPLV